MKRILFATALLLTVCGLQAQSPKKPLSHRQIHRLVNSVNERQLSGQRDFTMRFDTMFFYYGNQSSQPQLLFTMIPTYDDLGRVSENLGLSETDGDMTIRYFYNGDETRFSHAEIYADINGQLILTGTTRNIFNSRGALVSVMETDTEGEISYADSCDIVYDGQDRITGYRLLSFVPNSSGGEWTEWYNLNSITYSNDSIVSYIRRESFIDETGQDPNEYLLYKSAKFFRNKVDFLFPDIENSWNLDYTTVDQVFLSQKDYLDYTLNSPVSYEKFQLDQSWNPADLIEDAKYDDNGASLLITLTAGQDTTLVLYDFDDDDKVDYYYYISNGILYRSDGISYNEHGRISLILSSFAGQDRFWNYFYTIDEEGRLTEFKEFFISPETRWEQTLRFGYKNTAGSIRQTAASLDIFPNPASACVTVSLPENLSAGYRIAVRDASGRPVAVGAKAGPGCVIDTERLVPGAYFVEITDGATRYTGRFIRN